MITSLQGRRALVVEDESVVAMLLEDMLFNLGVQAEITMRFDAALECAGNGSFDFAILDINLGDGVRSDEIADRLQSRSIPFLFATGYGDRGVVERHRNAPAIQKPYRVAELSAAISRLLSAF